MPDAVPRVVSGMPDALRFLVLTVAGWVNRHQEELSTISERKPGPSGATGPATASPDRRPAPSTRGAGRRGVSRAAHAQLRPLGPHGVGGRASRYGAHGAAAVALSGSACQSGCGPRRGIRPGGTIASVSERRGAGPRPGDHATLHQSAAHAVFHGPGGATVSVSQANRTLLQGVEVLREPPQIRHGERAHRRRADLGESLCGDPQALSGASRSA